MKALLSKTRLTSINRLLYGRNVRATFYKVTPVEGETEIDSITSGFNIIRQSGSPAIKMLVAVNAGVDREDLKIGARVDLTVNGQTLKYSIVELLPMQQLGAGYAIRLEPLQGATG